jgi:hypothetical protein
MCGEQDLRGADGEPLLDCRVYKIHGNLSQVYSTFSVICNKDSQQKNKF